MSPASRDREADYDITFVEYQKRLAEMFDEELPEIFKWTDRHRRKYPVEEFEGVTLRPWIRQFWWLETAELPAANVIEFHDWPPERGAAKPAHFEGKFIPGQNTLRIVRCPGSTTTLWLSPEMVDFTQRITIHYNGEKKVDARADRGVLLEDVRRRADRQHPYWARLDFERNSWVQN
jgi:hypothetical protein